MFLQLTHFESRPQTLLHRLDPRSKSIMVFILICGILALQPTNPWQVIVYGLLLLILILWSRKGFFTFAAMILKVYPMILLITFFLPFTAAHSHHLPIYELGFIKMYESGLLRFMEINIKSVFILACTFLLLVTTGYSQLIAGLEKLGLPAWLTAILSYLYRLVFLLDQEMGRLSTAYQSRSIRLNGRRRFQYLSGMIVIYMMRILERSDRTYQAMISRGFEGRFFSSRQIRWQLTDSVFVALTIIFVCSNIFYVNLDGCGLL